MAVIQTEELTYTYSKGTPFEKTAVDHVNLSVEEGGIIGVMGHTGSGKSTLIQHFNGLIRPDSGRILLDGKDIWEDKTNLRDVRFKVGLVFQYPEYQILRTLHSVRRTWDSMTPKSDAESLKQLTI